MNNDLSLICCNLTLLQMNNKSQFLINDVSTNKKIDISHDNIPHEQLWMSVVSMINTCAQQIKSMPGTIMLIGRITNKADCIECSWGNGSPIVSMTSYSTYICYADLRDGQIELFDVLTDKHIVFCNLDKNENLKKCLATFKREISLLDYMKNGNRRVFIGGTPSDYDKDRICVDAIHVNQFGDTETVYMSILSGTLQTIAKSLDGNACS